MNDIIMTEKSLLTKHWWALAVRGICAIILGILAIAWSSLFAGALILIFGIYFLAQGVFVLFTAADMRKEEHRGSLILGGLLSIAAGIIIFALPGVVLGLMIWIVAFWALVTGILEIAATLKVPSGTGGKGLLFLSGILSVIIGLFLLTNPEGGLLAVLWLIGIYAILAGLTILGLAFQLRKLQR
jgi:uncharacterized membrane protein HdeD (DUF308 family)